MTLESAKPKRYLSLDVLRGLTVTFMCMCNNPGTWEYVYEPLRHTDWVGCRPVDLIYPFFVFCMGCAMAFSLSRYEGHPGKAAWKVVRRSVAIFAVGFALNCYPFFPTQDGHLVFDCDRWCEWMQGRRIFGVLQRIACAYLLAGLLSIRLKTPGKICIAIAALAVVYTSILVIFGTEPGPFTLEGTISRKIDVALLGESHVYHGYSFDDGTVAAFDPEGPLGTLTTACTCLLGFLIGTLIRKTGKEGGDGYAMCSRIFVYGILCLGAGLLVSLVIPISKPLWSVSFVLYAGGWAMVALAFLIYCIDLKGITKPFLPFKVMGMNAMMAFVLSGVIAKSYQFGSWGISQYFSANEFQSFLHACIFALVIMGLLTILYRCKIFIRL